MKRPIQKRLIDVRVGDRVLGVGVVQSVKIQKDFVELVTKDLGVEKTGNDPLQTFRWKGSQLVDVAEVKGGDDV